MSNPYDTQQIEYDMSDLERHSTYDQFLSLRDTLVFSGKKYAGKAGCKLCVGEKEKTVEIIWNNLFQQNFEAIDDLNAIAKVTGPYVKWDSEVASLYGQMSCVIQKEGRYKLIHKEEVMLTPTTNKVFCYIDIYRFNGQSYYLPYPGGVAVFDWECNTSNLTGSTSGTDPNGTCSVPFTFGKLFKKITAYGYMERNLEKGDILVLRAKDSEINPTTGEPQGNNLIFQSSSNYWSIEYLNLPINI